jgi:hypothetical protein
VRFKVMCSRVRLMLNTQTWASNGESTP